MERVRVTGRAGLRFLRNRLGAQAPGVGAAMQETSSPGHWSCYRSFGGVSGQQG